MSTEQNNNTNNETSETEEVVVFSNNGYNITRRGNSNDFIITGIGDDTVNAGGGHDLVFTGAGDDTINGGSGNDVIFSGSGDDTVDGGSGNDIIFSGSGDDIIDGSSGNDVIFGGSGDDTIDGGSGNDVIFGGSGDDTIDGSAGNDVIVGGNGNDTIDGSSGRDVIFGSSGDDTIDGSNGHDFIIGGAGNDTIDGGNGNDLIFGGSGHDVIDGGVGHDLIIGGGGNDTITGGAGSDIVFSSGGNDTVIYVLENNNNQLDFYHGGAGTDTLNLSFTSEEWMRPEIQADIAAYIAFLNGAPVPSGYNYNGSTFEFNAFDLIATSFEILEIKVDGIVIPPNNQPVDAVDDSFSVQENESVSGNILTNDSVPDLVETVELVETVTQGTLTFNPDGSFTYSLNGEFDHLAIGETATQTFTYRVTDTDGDTDIATVTITITGQNDVPSVSVIDAGSVTEDDAAVTIDLLATASDADTSDDLDTDNVTVVSSNTSRTVAFTIVNETGALTLDPSQFNDLAVGESETLTLNYTVTDGNGGVATNTATLVVTGLNDGPVVTPIDAGSVTEDDTPVTIDLLATASDADTSDDLDTDSVTVISNNTSRTVAFTIVNETGTLTLDPSQFNDLAVGESETLTVSYTVTDGNGGTDSATVTLTVVGQNDAPIVTAINVGSVTEDDAPMTIDLLQGQTDPDSTNTLSTINIIATDNLGNNVAFINNGDGTISIDPNQYDSLNDGESRDVTISYSVSDGIDTVANTASFVVTGLNDAPVAIDDLFENREIGEFLVNELTGNQNRPNVTTLSNGNFVVVWDSNDAQQGDTSETGIKARIFDIDGNEIVSEFLVNQFTNDSQFQPEITALSNGGFVVTWSSNDGQQGDTSFGGIKARIFNADGSQVVSEFLVNEITFNGQSLPSITELSNGNFIITWTSGGGDGNNTGLKARIFNSNGNEVVSEFLVNEFTNSQQQNSSITSLSNGNFVVTWNSLDQQQGDTDSWAIKARVFNANGNEVVSEFLVNELTNGGQTIPKITALSNGRFVITWSSSDPQQGDTDNSGIKARIFSANGNEIVSEFLVNELTNGFQETVSLATLSNGNFVVTWQSSDPQQGDTSGYGIKARIFDANGNEVVSEFLVNELTSSSQTRPDITALDDGRFIVTWRTNSNSDIKAKIFNADGTPATKEVANEDQIYTIFIADLLANDTDPDGDSLTVSSVIATSANGATVILNGDGTISYDPTSAPSLQALAEGETATDTFTYTISDGNGGTDTATVTLTVTGQNDAPVVTATDAGSVTEDDAPVTIDLLQGQTDPDSTDTLSAINILATDNLGNNVAFTNNGDGTISIDPNQYDSLNDGESRDVTISYSVSDGIDAIANTANLIVTGATDNSPPTAVDDLFENREVGEFLINELTSGGQDRPSISKLSNGNFAVAWQSTDPQQGDTSEVGVKARIFDIDGNEVVSEFLVNQFTNDSQSQPDITALSNGGFVVTWTSSDQQQGDTSFDAVKARIFDANGHQVVSEFLVNEITDNGQSQSSITALTNGGFVITWTAGGADGSSNGVKARIFDDNGNEVVSEFLVNEFTNSQQQNSSVTALSNGNFVVAWNSLDQQQGDVSSWGVKARVFNANGNEVASEFLVNEFTNFAQTIPHIAALSNGRFVITWNSSDPQQGDTSSTGLKARIFDTNGNEIVSEFLVNEFINGDQDSASVAALSNGNFVVTWQSSDPQQGDTSSFGIKARIFDVNGNEVISEFLVNELTSSTQLRPDITALDDGRFVVTWHTNTNSAIKAKIFNADGTPALETIANEDQVYTISTTDLLANDSDVDGDILTVTSVDTTSSFGAVVTLNGDGTISYDPTNTTALQSLANGETATDTFTYTISDGNGGTDTATVTLVVAGRDDGQIIGTSGDDTLIGDTDDNSFTGGDGNDTFVFNPGFGEDVITDFQAGELTEDQIQFDSLIFQDFNDVISSAVQSGNDTIITLSANDRITLKNVTLTDLDEDDFSFI